MQGFGRAARLAPLALATWCAQAAVPTSDEHLARQLQARVAGDRTGVCVQAAVIDGSAVRRAQACAGTRASPAPDAGAAFEIGSVTKTMTAYLVADLVARGAWSLDDPIEKHLPPGTTVPRQGERRILLRDLLTHTAGLPPVPPGMAVPDPADPYAAVNEKAVLAPLATLALTRPIGGQAAYSNWGMMLVSLAVSRALGEPVEPALRRRLFEPLGMAGAWVTPPAQAKAAQGHLPGGQPTPAWTIGPTLAGVGMVRATADDMVRYLRAQLGDGPPEVVARMRMTQQPLAGGFAMNWGVLDRAGRRVLAHEGGTGGFSSVAMVDPASRQAVVLLADTALSDLGGLGDLGLSLLGLDVPVQAPRVERPVPPELARAMVGTYQLGPMQLRITAAEGRLMAQATGQPAFELAHDSRGDFYPRGFSALLTPLSRAPGDGPVQRFAWRQGGGLQEAVRIGDGAAEPATGPAPAGQDWAGRYALAPQFAITVAYADGQWTVQGTGQPAIPAQVAGPDQLAIPAVGATVEFLRGADGQVTEAVLRQNGQTLKGQRAR